MLNGRQRVILFGATGGWIGYAPVAPGTFGSLAALPLCLLLTSMSAGPRIALLVVLLALFTWIAHAAERIVGAADPSQVVVDEIGGMAVALFGLPFEPAVVIGGFALFRVFDIVKPFPIRWIDRRIGGGVGIMLDDILAGVAANLLLRLIMH